MSQEIKGFNVSGLPNDNHMMFNKMVAERAQADAAVAAKFGAIITPYAAAVAAEDEAMHQIPGSELTPLIEAADASRDATYDAFERIVEGYQRYPDAQTTADAETLQRFMRVNKVSTAAQYDRETGQIMNLIQDLEANCAEELERLHLTPLLVRLKAENEEMYRLLNERDILNSERVRGLVRQARRRTDELYIALKNTVNAYALVEPGAGLGPFIAAVNETIDRLNLYVYKIAGSGGAGDSEGVGGAGAGSGSGSDEVVEEEVTEEETEGGSGSTGGNNPGSGSGTGIPIQPGPGGDDPDL